jgi:heat shock protein HslJ
MKHPRRFTALAVSLALFAGCASAPKEPPPKPFAGTHWQVLFEVPLAGEAPSMRFGDGRVVGFGGCNNFAAEIVQDAVGAGAIAVRRIELDRRLCDAGPRLAESRMLEVLQSVSSYSVTGSILTLSGSAGTLRLRAMDPKK